ncbi:uncharacterized protein F5Z01DRAFT_484166 [Emericellopsis atlantica]|uniref:Uncharacterized protein n=1 Tax=Emericellopsis atlantica TaxID=2614577 RepID=A0A9P8CRG5_9HYPO|nr:uncharacterized protein F5Z01DRAFT_484166 [Emericellopsis atlantica]KAG9256708.1 hypothetical protein F5Z01DRAFT_484166 [Emericellopsis atlantica]
MELLVYDRDVGFLLVGWTYLQAPAFSYCITSKRGREEGIFTRRFRTGLLDWTPAELREDWRQNATVDWEEVSLRCFLVSDLYHLIVSFLFLSFFNSQGSCIIVLRAGVDGVRDAYILVSP